MTIVRNGLLIAGFAALAVAGWMYAPFVGVATGGLLAIVTSYLLTRGSR